MWIYELTLYGDYKFHASSDIQNVIWHSLKVFHVESYDRFTLVMMLKMLAVKSILKSRHGIELMSVFDCNVCCITLHQMTKKVFLVFLALYLDPLNTAMLVYRFCCAFYLVTLCKFQSFDTFRDISTTFLSS